MAREMTRILLFSGIRPEDLQDFLNPFVGLSGNSGSYSSYATERPAKIFIAVFPPASCHWRVPGLERERKRKRPVVSLGEEDLLLQVAAPHLRPIIITALDAGMCRNDILPQVMEDVDFERRLLLVPHSKTPEGEAREIPLTQRLFQLLSAMHKAKSHGLIFTFEGNPIHSVKRAWKTGVRRSGVRPCRFHDLRHSFNTRLLEAGVMR
jgi:integrase